MSCRNCWRWHFRDPKYKNFLGEHAPRLPQVWVAFGTLTFLSLRAPSKFHATLLTTGILYLNMKSVPKDGRGELAYKGLEVERGGWCILKIVIARGNFQMQLFGRGWSFDTPHFSENPRPPLRRNKRSVPYNGTVPAGIISPILKLHGKLMKVRWISDQ